MVSLIAYKNTFKKLISTKLVSQRGYCGNPKKDKTFWNLRRLCPGGRI